MNILINTPLLKSNALKESFDNKILALFLGIVFSLLIIGLLFIDLRSASFKGQEINQDIPSSPSKGSINV